MQNSFSPREEHSRIQTHLPPLFSPLLFITSSTPSFFSRNTPSPRNRWSPIDWIGWGGKKRRERKGERGRRKGGEWVVDGGSRVEYQPTRSPGRAPALVRLRLNSCEHASGPLEKETSSRFDRTHSILLFRGGGEGGSSCIDFSRKRKNRYVSMTYSILADTAVGGKRRADAREIEEKLRNLTTKLRESSRRIKLRIIFRRASSIRISLEFFEFEG